MKKIFWVLRASAKIYFTATFFFLLSSTSTASRELWIDIHTYKERLFTTPPSHIDGGGCHIGVLEGSEVLRRDAVALPFLNPYASRWKGGPRFF
ncbi:hypothetical protein K440DRAFT_295536 [Wilcoxina mikolae CBS 423.85]|nr:hypothetical protein K440DRAFT_295536 [Wilcoxina mikolae CBS 423.85]